MRKRSCGQSGSFQNLIFKGHAFGIVFLIPFFRYQHVQAITVAIDQYSEKALGNRDYFLNKPYGVGWHRCPTAYPRA